MLGPVLWGDDLGVQSVSALPLGVQLPAVPGEFGATNVWLVASRPVLMLVLLLMPAASFVGDAAGVDDRKGDGEAGDSGRRNGELRGDPYDRGDGLYPAGIA